MLHWKSDSFIQRWSLRRLWMHLTTVQGIIWINLFRPFRSTFGAYLCDFFKSWLGTYSLEFRRGQDLAVPLSISNVWPRRSWPALFGINIPWTCNFGMLLCPGLLYIMILPEIGSRDLSALQYHWCFMIILSFAHPIISWAYTTTSDVNRTCISSTDVTYIFRKDVALACSHGGHGFRSEVDLLWNWLVSPCSWAQLHGLLHYSFTGSVWRLQGELSLW